MSALFHDGGGAHQNLLTRSGIGVQQCPVSQHDESPRTGEPRERLCVTANSRESRNAQNVRPDVILKTAVCLVNCFPACDHFDSFCIAGVEEFCPILRSTISAERRRLPAERLLVLPSQILLHCGRAAVCPLHGRFELSDRKKVFIGPAFRPFGIAGSLVGLCLIELEHD
jgi:hypothetical protein